MRRRPTADTSGHMLAAGADWAAAEAVVAPGSVPRTLASRTNTTMPVRNARATVSEMSPIVASEPVTPLVVLPTTMVAASESVVAPMKSFEPVVNMRALPDHLVT